MVKKIALLLIVVLLSIVIFAPKRELYYLLENKLVEEDIIISQEKINAGLFSLDIIEPDLYIKGLKIASVKRVKVTPLLFFTTASVREVQFDPAFDRWVAGGVTKITATHQLFDPFRIQLVFSGGFGEARGYADMQTRMMHLDFLGESVPAKLRALFRKGEKGWYYETSF